LALVGYGWHRENSEKAWTTWVLVPADDSVLSTFNIPASEIAGWATMVFLLLLASLLLLSFLLWISFLLSLLSLLLLPSLLLAVASIFADFQFTILASVLTFYKWNVSDDGYLIISHFVWLSDCWDIKHRTIGYQISKIYIAQLC
jgi:hypothetical protein